MAKKFNVKYCVFLPIVLIITIFLWAVPVSFYGIEALTVVQQHLPAGDRTFPADRFQQGYRFLL